MTSTTDVSIIHLESVEDIIPMLSRFPLFAGLIEIDVMAEIDIVIQMRLIRLIFYCRPTFLKKDSTCSRLAGPYHIACMIYL